MSIIKFRVNHRNNVGVSPQLSEMLSELRPEKLNLRQTVWFLDPFFLNIWMIQKQIRTITKSYYEDITTKMAAFCLKRLMYFTEKCFNEHFVSSGSLFESLHQILMNRRLSVTTQTQSVLQSFSFSPLNVLEVHSTLNLLDPNKSAGLNILDPYFLNKMLEQNC